MPDELVMFQINETNVFGASLFLCFSLQYFPAIVRKPASEKVDDEKIDSAHVYVCSAATLANIKH